MSTTEPEYYYRRILKTIDRSFDAGNKENFILNEILLIVSVFLLFFVGLHLMSSAGMIIIAAETTALIHNIEVFFGILFMFEFLLRTIYVYIPDKKILCTLYNRIVSRHSLPPLPSNL